MRPVPMVTSHSFSLLLLVALISFFFLPTFSQRTIKQDALRSTIVSSQLRGNPTISSATNINNLLVNSVRSLPRFSVYSATSGSAKAESAPNKLEVPNINSGVSVASFSKQIAYVQGVALHSLWGIIGLALALVWLIVVWIMGCVCCSMNCCIKYEENEEKLQHEQPVEWKNSYDRRERCSKICRFIMVVWILVTLVLLIIWAIFAYQVNLDVSLTMDSYVAAEENVESIVDQGLALVDTANSTVKDVMVVVEDVVDEIFTLLPNASRIDQFQACISSVMNGLPNATNLENFVDDLYDAVDNLPQVDGLKDTLTYVEGEIRTVRTQTLGNIEEKVKAINESIGSFKPELLSINATLTDMNSVLHNLPNLTLTKEIVSNLDAPLINPLNDTFLANLASSMRTLSSPPPGCARCKPADVSADLSTLADEVEKLRNVPIGTLIDQLKSLNSTLESLPSVTLLMQSVADINATLHSINILAIKTDVLTLNSTVGSLTSVARNLTAVIADLKTKANTLPSFNVVKDELAKVNQTVDRLACAQAIVDTLISINNTLLILPDSIMSISTQFSAYREQLRTMDFSFITDNINRINETISTTLPKAFEKFDELDIESLLQKMPDISSILKSIDDAQTSYNNAIASFDPSGIYNQLKDFDNTLSNRIPDVSVHIQPLQDVNDTLYDIDTNQLRMFSGLIALCPPTGCPLPPAGANAVADKIDNFKAAVNGRPSKTAIFSQLDSAQDGIDSFPKINTFTDKIGNVIHTLDNLPGFSSITTTIQNANNSLSSFDTLPFDSFRAQLDSFKNVLAELPSRQMAKSALSSATNALNEAQNYDTSAMFDQVKQLLQTFSVSSLLGQVDTFLNPVSSTVSTVSNYRETANTYKQQYGTEVYKYDGIRLLITTLIIIFCVPVPLLALLSCCCHRKPCCLMALSQTYAFFALVCLLVMAIFIPANILVADTCSEVNNLVYSAIDIYVPSFKNQSLEVAVQIPQTTATLQISLKPYQLLNSYMTGCKGNDYVGDTLDNIKNVAINLTSTLDQFLNVDVGNGIKIHPNAFKYLDPIKKSIVNATGLLDTAKNLVGCKRLSGVWTDAKDAVCVSTNALFTNLWFLAFLMMIMLLCNSCFNCTSYWCLRRNWTSGLTKPGREDIETPAALLIHNNNQVPSDYMHQTL